MAIISISRQPGSLGDEIAELLAKKLGLRLVGGVEFHRLAQECDAEFSNACQAFETEKSTGFFERLFFRDRANLPLFAAMNYELAAEGDVIIKGRGAQLVFREDPEVLKVRVAAPTRIRVQRLAQRKGMKEDEARDYLRRLERQRRGLIESVFHHDLSDWGLYDLVVNTRHMDAQGASEVVVASVEALSLKTTSADAKEQYRRLALAKRVEAAIKKRVDTSPYRDMSVEPGEAYGEVVLTGFVPDYRNQAQAVSIASEYPGVTKADNKLKTTELSF